MSEDKQQDEHSDTFAKAGIATIIVLLLVILGINLIRPKIEARKADAYGSDYLVIQENYDGSVRRYWELKDSSIGNESGSDGIYFTDKDGNVVHLSGECFYVQVKDGKWEEARKTYLRTK